MHNSAKFEIGTLTLVNPADGSILGELSEARWKEENHSGGTNYVLSGLAGDGTLDTLGRFIDNGQDTVSYNLSDGNRSYSGQAMLLKPAPQGTSSGTEIRIESPTRPSELISSR
jgi:hypothetical protein